MMSSVGGSGKGTGGSQQTDAPKLIVDNRAKQAPLVEATGHRGSQLFGSIAWDPYQNASLGTPEHQRVTAGDVHRANLGILFIDEIKNLAPEEAVTLLTVLQEGKIPVTMRGISGGSDTAAMAVSTEPIPAMVFLVAAGNLDSIAHIHPALMDRIYGYGKIVKMNNDMPNTVENRRKYVQFIAQEIKNFNLPPFTHEACLAVIAEARRKSGKNDFLTCRFRQMVAVIKTAGNLALNENAKLVEKRHVEEALKRCRTVFEQVLETEIKNSVAYKMINPNAEPQVGQIYGLAVKQLSEDDAGGIGAVLTIRASMVPAHKKGGFTVTGVSKKDDSWVQNSIAKVRHVFTQLYSKDPMDFLTHIDFVQENLIEGPSAGVAMTLALISAYTKKKIRQDVAVTGEINIGGNGEIDVTAVGGVPEKILAAQSMNFKKVCIPARNYEKNIVPSDYTIQIVPCKTLRDYIKEVFVEGEQ
jgi:Lon-like ATP-dependent protease